MECDTDAATRQMAIRVQRIMANGSAKIVEVSAVDKSDNPASADHVSLEVKDSNGVDLMGTRYTEMKIRYAMRMDGLTVGVRDYRQQGRSRRVHAGTVTFGTQKETVEIVVAGDPANLELTTDVETVAVGDFVTVDGNGD